MSFYKFKESDLLINNIKAYPQNNFFIYDSKVYYNLVIDKDLPNEGIKDIIPVDPLKIKKVRKVHKEVDKSGKNQMVSLIKDIEEYYIYTNTDKESQISRYWFKMGLTL